MDLTTLCARVDTLYVGDHAWPDPHTDGGPDPEEYSRCEEPQKYRVVAARVTAWVQALEELDLVAGQEPLDWAPRGTPQTRSRRIRARRTGTLPLVLGVRGFDGLDDNVLSLGAGDPPVHLATVPECGCDACDSGSGHLLQEVDDRVLDVVSGEFAHVATNRGFVQGYRDGWSSDLQDATEIERLLQEARTGNSPHDVVHGLPWW